jgi:hypothetical protein
VLSHDSSGTVEAMPSTFDQLEAKGVSSLSPSSELLDMATPVTPHPKAEAAEKTAAKVAPCCSSIFSGG